MLITRQIYIFYSHHKQLTGLPQINNRRKSNKTLTINTLKYNPNDNL